MLEQVLRHIHNRFERECLSGTFEIFDGTLAVEGAQDGQYVWIEGSVFNDGLHEYPLSALVDETFDGRIWLLAIPAAVMDVAGKISDWCEANRDSMNSPYQSESFGGYSYTMRSDAGSGDGASLSGWQARFRNDLDPWRKMYHAGW